MVNMGWLFVFFWFFFSFGFIIKILIIFIIFVIFVIIVFSFTLTLILHILSPAHLLFCSLIHLATVWACALLKPTCHIQCNPVSTSSIILDPDPHLVRPIRKHIIPVSPTWHTIINDPLEHNKRSGVNSIRIGLDNALISVVQASIPRNSTS